MPDGLVTRGQGGLYYIQVADSTIQCTARGKIKKETGDLAVGDLVSIDILPDGEGVIKQVYPRRNSLVRPAIANVDLVVTVFSICSPDPIPLLIDKFLVMIEAAGLRPLLAFTKCDLCSETGDVSWLPAAYRSIGYSVHETSSVTCHGIDGLRHELQDKVSVFSGPSGVGKSALLNRLQSGLVLQTGEISTKIRRGRHTTRHASLMPLEGGGWVADTPGFSVLELSSLKKENLQECFPDIIPFIGLCRFNGCIHRAEPDCAVKSAVTKGDIQQFRYDDYLMLLQEIEALPPEWARKSEDTR